jgi:hypothetical protein
MRNIVRLTEKDLTKLVKRVINEQISIESEDYQQMELKTAKQKGVNETGTYEFKQGVLYLTPKNGDETYIVY